MERHGVIDMGTNTFHLLIVEETSNGFSELYRNRFFIKLAEEGIQTIGQAAFKRGLNAIKYFKQVLDEYKVTSINAFGTAALRTASNGQYFIEEVYEYSSIKVELISGEEEALLIYKGVKHALPLPKEASLIIDIGGGSVEFIIADLKGICWAQSFPIGLAILYNNFHSNNPISDFELKGIHAFLDDQLQPLFDAIDNNKIHTLIGAAGIFDVLENILGCKKNIKYANIPLSNFSYFYNKLVKTTTEERKKMPEIPDTRADMIIVSNELIQYIINKVNIQQILVSKYAMKEGMLLEMMQANPIK